MSRLHFTLPFVVLLCGLFLSFTTDPDAMERNYILTYQEFALSEMSEHGIPASITLAQAVVESDAGQSILAQRANNHFGIKCKSWWTGDTYYYADDDRSPDGKLLPSCFRYYDSPKASFEDHSAFLRYSDRYLPLFSCGMDYKAWATGLQQCGYATDARYATRLIEVIETHRLFELDGN